MKEIWQAVGLFIAITTALALSVAILIPLCTHLMLWVERVLG